MTDFKLKLDNIALAQVRSNTGYSAGIMVNAASVLQENLKSPWVKSTLSLNAYDKADWATTPQANKVGVAVVVRNPEGAGFRTIVNPKMSIGGIAGESGKSDSLDTSVGSTFIEAEVIFPAGKGIAPTVVAARSRRSSQPTVAAKAAELPPVTDATGKDTTQSAMVGLTFQGTNNFTGTIQKMTGESLKMPAGLKDFSFLKNPLKF
jgi:hypothetical protein